MELFLRAALPLLPCSELLPASHCFPSDELQVHLHLSPVQRDDPVSLPYMRLRREFKYQFTLMPYRIANSPLIGYSGSLLLPPSFLPPMQ